MVAWHKQQQEKKRNLPVVRCQVLHMLYTLCASPFFALNNKHSQIITSFFVFFFILKIVETKLFSLIHKYTTTGLCIHHLHDLRHRYGSLCRTASVLGLMRRISFFFRCRLPLDSSSSTRMLICCPLNVRLNEDYSGYSSD